MIASTRAAVPITAPEIAIINEEMTRPDEPAFSAIGALILCPIPATYW